MDYLREFKGLPKVWTDMLLKGSTLIPIDTDIAILSYNLGSMVFAEKEKKLFSFTILWSLVYKKKIFQKLYVFTMEKYK